MLRLLTSLAISVFLLSCSSQPHLKEGKRVAAKHQFSVIASMNRRLTLEPCGCSYVPEGGLEWEAHLWDAWKQAGLKDFLFLSGGNTFEHSDPVGPRLTTNELLLKAQTLVEGLNLQELHGLGMTAGDFQFNAKTMQALRSKSKFPWIATNLQMDRRSLFEPFFRYERSGVSIVVFSLSSAPKKKLPKGIRWISPEEALAAQFAVLPKTPNSFIVVLSDLSDTDREAVVEKFPDIHLWIGNSEANTHSLAFDLIGPHTLYASPRNLGRVFARVDVATNARWDTYRIPGYEASTRPTYERLSEGLKRVEEELRSGKSESEKKELESNLVYYRKELARYQFIAESENPEAATLTLHLSPIGKEFDKGPNRLTPLLQSFRKKIAK